MVPFEVVVGAYRRHLLRDATREEASVYAAHAPDVDWLEREIRSSAEHSTIVEPIRRLLVHEWRQWAFREPTEEELRTAVATTRARCGGDDQVRRAMADGSIRTKLAFRPLKIEMDITNRCNLRCVMCPHSRPEYYGVPRRDISVEQFTAIAEQVFHRCHQVSLSYGTEPLLHREVDKLIAVLGRQEVPHTYMNTNGLLLREQTIEAMIEHHFDFLLVSVDGATKETYERIRVGASFERLLAKLALVRELRSVHGAGHPKVGLGFVILRQNMSELPAFVEMAARVGARSVNAGHMVAWDLVGNADMAANLEKERCNAALIAARRRAEELGIVLVAPQPFGAEAPNGTLVPDVAGRAREFGLEVAGIPRTSCSFPWGFAAIDPYGEVMPCGWWDAAKHGSMGNVYETDFPTIWRGRAFGELRRRLMDHRLEGSCARCPAAGMGAPDAASAFQRL